MASLRCRHVAILAATALSLFPVSSFAQSGAAKPAKPPQQQAAAPDTAKQNEQLRAEYGEAAQTLRGRAGHPECVWLGRRVVALMWRDDIDTAFRHLALYDRFGCPGDHVQAAFRCVVLMGDIDPKQPESLRDRVKNCWLRPTQATAPASTPAAASTAAPPQK